MIRDKINKQIDDTALFLGLTSTIQRTEVKLTAIKEVNRAIIKGVYIAFTNEAIIYVGQGRVRKRLERLSEKIIGGNFAEMRAKDTDGFEYLRANHSVNISDCSVIYFDCETYADSSAFEGVLIKTLKPLANSETFKDLEKPIVMIQNIIQLEANKSSFDSGSLVVNGIHLQLPDTFQVFDTLQGYKDSYSALELAQSHFDGHIAYISDVHTLVVGGNIEDLSDKLASTFSTDSENAEATDVNDFQSFIEKVSEAAKGPFKIATQCWEEIGVAVYYIKYDKEFQSARLDFDDWEETDFFEKIAHELGIDPDSDDFYDDDDDHEEMKSPCQQVCDEIHENHLNEDITVLAPDWY